MIQSSSGNQNNKDKKEKSPNQLNKDIQTGKSPSSVERIDIGKIKGEQTHIHFKDGNALNKDGTWKHGGRDLSNSESSWLKESGWNLPNN